jgi:hypothetical protein
LGNRVIETIDLRRLREIQRLLDEAFRIPGTPLRFGWDSIIGLVPWAGDLVAALMGCAIIVQAHRVSVPRIVLLRMLLNVAIDLAIGLVPFVGDIADIFWKSNSKNMALLEAHLVAGRQASTGDWLFVAGILGAVLALASLPLVLFLWLVNALTR